MKIQHKRYWQIAGLILGTALLVSGALANVNTVQTFFPTASQMAPWQKDGALQIYRGKQLREYLDGGADIYLEYGFKKAAVQTYKKGDQSLQIEIFQMQSPLAALGLFSIRRHYPADSTVVFPNESSRYDFLFTKGSYFVAVTNMDGSPGTAKILKKTALYILKNIPGGLLRQEPFSVLPTRGLLADSPMNFNGPLAMRVRWPLGQIHCFHFDRGTYAVTAHYRSHTLHFSLFIIFPGKRVDFYSLVECFGNILNATMMVKSNQKIVLTMMNSKKTIFLKKGQQVWIIPDLFDDLPVLKFLGE